VKLLPPKDSRLRAILPKTVTTGRDGRFVLAKLLPGTYQIMVMPLEAHPVGKPCGAVEATVSLAEGYKKEIEMRFE
jgi:hypothetical protein